jgi:hypothetical protein
MGLIARAVSIAAAGVLVVGWGCGENDRSGFVPGPDGSFHVYPGQDIQAALETAALDPAHKVVKVHAGTYRPGRPGQAMIWFNARHDGIRLEAVGAVVLTAANPDVADRSAPSFPAIVNHVVYFGDGVSPRTVLSGFGITGANNFATRVEEPGPIQPDSTDGVRWVKGIFFYGDGGGIKIFGRSYPTIENVEVYDNFASPCGGGVSIEHRGSREESVVLRNCVFRGNRCQVTGSAVDLLPRSSAVIENCLFVGNIANTGLDYIGRWEGSEYNKENGSGVLTVFPGSRVSVRHCTFTDNWNGVDDKGIGNSYVNSIFWMNVRSGGISHGPRYELDILDGSRVIGCFINGEVDDLRSTVSVEANVFDAPDPEFDGSYRPRAAEYASVGYRPTVATAPGGMQP